MPKNDKTVSEEKFVSCKEQVKAKNPGANEYAICTESLGGQPASYHAKKDKKGKKKSKAAWEEAWIKKNCKFAQAPSGAWQPPAGPRPQPIFVNPYPNKPPATTPPTTTQAKPNFIQKIVDALQKMTPEQQEGVLRSMEGPGPLM